MIALFSQFVLETVGKQLHFHFKLNYSPSPWNYPNNARFVKIVTAGLWAEGWGWQEARDLGFLRVIGGPVAFP